MAIQLSIVAGPDYATSSVNASGSEQHIITEEERKTFGLSDKPLKDAVAKYFGKAPNDAFLHSPTPWNDLYKTYGWPEVKTVVTAARAEIRGITYQPTIVARKTLVNNSTKKAKFDANISQQVSNTATHSWSYSNSIQVGQKINYKVTIKKIFDLGGETSFSYTRTWGEGGSESRTTTVGSASGVSVELEPGEAVEARLIAMRGVMQVRIFYQAHLEGMTAVNYNPTYKGHHFWALPIGSVMNAAGLQRDRQIIEDIEVGFYTDDRVEIIDTAGAVKAVISLADQPGAGAMSA